MFFVVAKLFSFVAEPSHFGLILLVLGTILLFTRYRRLGRACVALVALGAAFVMPGGEQFVERPLENRFPAKPALCHVDGFIMLGGGEAPKLSASRGMPILSERSGKYFAAIELMRRFPEAKLIIAAGSGAWVLEKARETDVAAGLFAQAGIDPNRLIFDSESRDTFENFENAKALVHPKPSEHWVLLTKALHMPRSVAIARKVGFPVVPWPTDYHTKQDETDLEVDFGSSIAKLDAAFHEWVGLAAYRLTGRLDELMPAPEPDPDGCGPTAPAVPVPTVPAVP